MNKLTPRSRVFLEKLTVPQLVNKFPSFYGTRKFITVFTTVRHLSLSWARSIQSMAPTPTISWRTILIWSSNHHIGLPNALTFRFPHQNRVCAYHLSHPCNTHRPSHSSRFDHPNVWREVQIKWKTRGRKYLRWTDFKYVPLQTTTSSNIILHPGRELGFF